MIFRLKMGSQHWFFKEEILGFTDRVGVGEEGEKREGEYKTRGKVGKVQFLVDDSGCYQPREPQEILELF